MTETEVIRSMVLSFRLLELQDLLLFAGKSKLGKKSELQVGIVYEIYIVRNIFYNSRLRTYYQKGIFELQLSEPCPRIDY